MLGNLGSWWNGGQTAGGYQNPLAGYADRMRAAGAAAPVTSPLVASYTPPAYQTTPSHVDINAVIAAMNAAKAGAPVPSGPAPSMPVEGWGGGEGMGEMGNFERADTRSGETVGMNADTGDRTSEARGLATGGPVTAANMSGPNPPGPDDGMVPLDKGEYVIRADAAKKVGAKALGKINEGGDDSAEIAKEVTRRVSARNDRNKGKK